MLFTHARLVWLEISGTLKYANGNLYVGSWEAGVPSGEGTQTFANGDTYSGRWKNGKMSGQVWEPGSFTMRA